MKTLKMNSFFLIMGGMVKYRFYLLILFVTLLCQGCGTGKEVLRKMWGSSTEALEKARTDAIVRYYEAQWQECYDVIIELCRPKVSALDSASISQPAPRTVGVPLDSEEFDSSKTGVNSGIKLFMKNPDKRLIVVMGIPGSIDTTEVGVFFTSMDKNVTRVEISSLSTKAKRTASEIIFAAMEEKFKKFGSHAEGKE